MRLSSIPISTLRDNPVDAEVPSHRLLTRACFIQKLAAGLYIYSPLMWRVLRKIQAIVREELELEGAREILMPIMQPKEIWEASGRWARYIADGQMFHLKDKKGTEVCLGPTHEEVVTLFVKSLVKSYKQLPLNLYQIQDKFRDEIRPRFGLMRSREFIMKDAYSFDVDEEGLDASYAAMDRAYRKIFTRCGLEFTAVEADAGAIGGSGSQEYMVTADTGEDAIMHCPDCDYAANVEKADSRVQPSPDGGAAKELSKESTPDIKSVEQLVDFFGLGAQHMVKTLIYKATHEDRELCVAVLMRGDLEINPVKVCNATGALGVELASEEQVKTITGAEVGFAGPIGLPEATRVLADKTLEGMSNLLSGCCETDFHCKNVNMGRDFAMPEFHDLRLARAGDGCPRCDSGKLVQTRGIEVGHIFKLGSLYSKKLDATFLDQNGKLKPFVMGCYGLGISRTAAAAVEQNHDENGMIWPRPIAPFEVVIAILNNKNSQQVELAEKLYQELMDHGVDVCLDDRSMSPGAKFKDLDLMGFPLHLIIGRGAADGMVEFAIRKSGEKRDLPASEVREAIQVE